MTDIPDYSALIGSRICHDLVNPIGAIGNGVELMLMDGAAKGPELTLIAESVANANARIRFFRIAFGASGDQRMSRAEVQSILTDVSRGGRIDIGWQSEGDLARRDARLAFLAIQCCETAMPYGGTIRVEQSGENWRVIAKAPRLRLDRNLWDGLASGKPKAEITPASVQFALLADCAARLKRRLHAETAETELRLGF